MASTIVFVTCVAIQLLIFVPKIRYERQRRSANDGVQISGLQPIPHEQASMPASLGASEASCPEDVGADSGGEKILSDETRQQLASEVMYLKKRLKEFEEPEAKTTDLVEGD